MHMSSPGTKETLSAIFSLGFHCPLCCSNLEQQIMLQEKKKNFMHFIRSRGNIPVTDIETTAGCDSLAVYHVIT